MSARSVEFRQTSGGRGFLLLDLFLTKSHFNGWGYLEAGMAVFTVPKIGTE